MFKSRCIGGCLTLVMFAVPALADGLFYTLPKDGTWAMFAIDAKNHVSDTPITGELRTVSIAGELRIASVGQVIENGVTCRWIEVQYQHITTTQQPKWIFKLLIPEKHLVQGETPLKHILRAWVRMEAPDPFGFAAEGEMKTEPDSMDISNSILPIVLSGPWNKTVQLADLPINSGRLGKLYCKGVRGILEKSDNNHNLTKYGGEYRLHSRSPFGIVTFSWGDISGNDGEMVTLTLIDYGEDAKSKINVAEKEQETNSTCSNQTLFHRRCARNRGGRVQIVEERQREKFIPHRGNAACRIRNICIKRVLGLVKNA
jgi:hypothetical protein